MSAATRHPVQHDVVIVGASVSGSAVATLARDHGLSVALVDALPRNELGVARRGTPVPVWALEESRLPVGEVIRVPARLHLVAGTARIAVATPDCVLVDPAALARSLVERAVGSGASLYERSRVLRLARQGSGVELEDGTTILGRFVIDASGAGGASLLGEHACEPCDVTSVAHETRRIVERRLADAYLEASGVERGESVALLAPCGPGSVVVVRVDEDARTLSFDAVTFSDGGSRCGPTARAAIRRVARGFSWLGETTCEESRHVALGGLRATLATDDVALVGSAAGATRPGLGGECAFGIVSARMLVDSLASKGDLSRYERRVRARFDAIAENDQALARHLRGLEEGDLAALLESGTIGERLVSAILEQRVARLASLRFCGAAALRSGRAALVRAFDPRPVLQAMPILAKLGGRG